jgi:hypothetical protein
MYARHLIRRRIVLIGFAVITTLCPLKLGSVAQAAPVMSNSASSARSTTTTLPQTAVTITPLPINSGRGGSADAISCTAPKECVVGGTEFLNASTTRGVLSVEINGAWRPAVAVGPDLRGATSTIVRVVCPKSGACVALGQLLKVPPGATAQFSSYFVVQHGSHWAASQMIPNAGLGSHPSYLLTGMACVAAGSCVLTGTLLVNPSLDRVFSLTWRNGVWGTPDFLASSSLGAKAHLASFNALSCVGSWCEGVGLFKNSSQKLQPYVATYSGGRWRSIHALAAYRPNTNTNLLGAISCTGVGTCVASGESDPLRSGGSSALVVEENHGRWTAPYALHLSGANVFDSISCTAAASCTGLITHTAGDFVGVATMSVSRHWNVSAPTRVLGWSNFQGWSLSCVAGQCVIAGDGTTTSTGPLQPIAIISRAG